MRKSDLTKILKKTMLNVDYMLDVAIQEIGNANLLKKEWVENIKDNTAYVYIKTESFEHADLIIRKIIGIWKEYGVIFTDKKDYLKNPDSKGKYGLFLLAEKADEFNHVLNNLDENTICEIRHGENAKILEQYERIAKTDRLGEFERRLERKQRKETHDRYLQGYKNGTPGPYQRRIIYMPPL